jgi:hypothetical protein
MQPGEKGKHTPSLLSGIIRSIFIITKHWRNLATDVFISSEKTAV